MLIFSVRMINMDNENDDVITKVDEYDEDDILFQVRSLV